MSQHLSKMIVIDVKLRWFDEDNQGNQTLLPKGDGEFRTFLVEFLTL